MGVFVSVLNMSKINNLRNDIEMQDSRVQLCLECQESLITGNDKVDGIIPRFDNNSNQTRFTVKRLKIACRHCQQNGKTNIQVETFNQQRHGSQSHITKQTFYARQTSRGS